MNRDERFLYTTAGVETPPETPEQRRAREDREFMESIRLDNNVPKLTEAEIIRSVQTGKGVWRSLTAVRQEKIDAEIRAEAERKREQECPTLREIPAPEF